MKYYFLCEKCMKNICCCLLVIFVAPSMVASDDCEEESSRISIASLTAQPTPAPVPQPQLNLLTPYVVSQNGFYNYAREEILPSLDEKAQQTLSQIIDLINTIKSYLPYAFVNIDIEVLAYLILSNYYSKIEVPLSHKALYENNEFKYNFVDVLILGYAHYLKPFNEYENYHFSWNTRFFTLSFIKELPDTFKSSPEVLYIREAYYLYNELKGLDPDILMLNPQSNKAMNSQIKQSVVVKKEWLGQPKALSRRQRPSAAPQSQEWIFINNDENPPKRSKRTNIS